MMKFPKLNYKLKIKRVLIQCVALLFVVYALADITVLEAYCGNESVGIPPSHHLVAKQTDNPDENKHSQATDQNYIQQSDQQEGSQQTCDDDCCFCCSSHVVVSSFFIKSNIIKISGRNNAQSVHYKNKYSNSDLKNLFRPPRNA